MISAAHEVREWAAVLIAQYENAVNHVTIPVPDEIAAHLKALQS